MKLKKILPYIDAFVRIWDNVSTEEENWQIVYEGDAADIPWVYSNRKLINREDNGGDEAICPFQINNKVYLRITLAQEEETI